jgi:FKBP-type peptidyl-prolyl cis-trans isomerase (trigger factor)
MKTEIKEASKYGKEILFEIDKETVEKEKQVVIKGFLDTAKVPGFRPGKIPESVIQIKYSEEIKKQIIENLIRHSYLDFIKQSNIESIIDPEISDVKLDTVLNFKVYIETKPDTIVKKYKEIVVKKTEPEPFGNEDVEKVMTQYEKNKEFAISVIDPEKRKAWKEKIANQFTEYNKQKALQVEEEQIWKEIFQNSEVEIPERFLFNKTRKIAEDLLKSMDLTNKTKEEIDKIVDDTLKKAKPYTEDQLKKYFILEKIVEMENIDVSPGEIEESLQKVSLDLGDSASNIKKRLEETGRLDDWKEDLKIEKAFQFIKNNSKWIEKIILPGEKNEKKEKPIE